MGIADAEQPALDLDGKIELGAGREIADVHVAADAARRNDAECGPGSAGARPMVPQNGFSGTRAPWPNMAGRSVAGLYFQI